MNTKIYFYRNCSRHTDLAAINDLFYAVREELHLPDRAAVEKMTALIFDHGGLTGAFDGPDLVAAAGYFFGDPAEDFADRSILFCYVAAILPAHRGDRIFREGLLYTMHAMQGTGVDTLRMQAEATNPFTNGIYRRFAEPVGHGLSLRGHEVINYEAPIAEVVQRMAQPRRHSAANLEAV